MADLVHLIFCRLQSCQKCFHEVALAELATPDTKAHLTDMAKCTADYLLPHYQVLDNTARWMKGGGRRVFSQIEPHLPLPYSTVLVPLLRDAI